MLHCLFSLVGTISSFTFAGYHFKWSQKMRNLWERKLILGVFGVGFIIFAKFQRKKTWINRCSPKYRCNSFKLWNRCTNFGPERKCYLRREKGLFFFHKKLENIVIYFQNIKKVIELPMINSRTDCNALSKEVINNCDLIHHSRLAEVEQIIYYLKKRRLQISGKSKYQTFNS